MHLLHKPLFVHWVLVQYLVVSLNKFFRDDVLKRIGVSDGIDDSIDGDFEATNEANA